MNNLCANNRHHIWIMGRCLECGLSIRVHKANLKVAMRDRKKAKRDKLKAEKK